ncbi:cation diffusion facilitator family transporter [Paenibacillus senegalimassiliensis]|uniref:cation diffusion facilitator family transporter n=1 Tax=Paenibacillus senegalimassiliensis TaxID=1737426 RepID=UPI00073EA7DA|nr:cation diffusion facilitator family transporter [Paenibacillus senegalimassiliensis]
MTREQDMLLRSTTWLGIVSDVGLAIFKGIIGWMFGSQALMAGALYSTHDAAVSAAIKLRFPELSGRNRQKGSLPGKETVKPLPAIFLSIFLMMGALQLLIAGITAIVTADITPPETLPLIAILLSMALKELVFQLQVRQVGRDAVEGRRLVDHHRQSLFSSVTILVGVAAAMGGHVWDIPALLYLEPIAAIIVACHILLRSYHLVKTSLYDMPVFRMQEEDAASFIETVQRVHGVIAVEELRALENGHYVTISAKISVNPKITVLEANDIANRARLLLLNRFSHVIDVRIQVKPYDAGYPYKSNTEESDNDLPSLLQ